MKNTLSLLLFILLSVQIVMGQSSTEDAETPVKKHEINFSITTSLSNNDWSYYWFYDSYDLESLYILDQWQNKNTYGIGYKYNLSNGALRVKLYGIYNDDTFKDSDKEDNTETTTNYTNTRIDARLGYEFQTNLKRARIFYGIDAICRISQFKYNYNYEYEGSDNPYFYNPPYTIKTRENLDRNSFGISPFIGIKYFITPNISVFTETMLIAEYYEGKYKYKRENTSASSSEDKSSTSGMNFNFGPIGQLGIGIHF